MQTFRVATNFEVALDRRKMDRRRKSIPLLSAPFARAVMAVQWYDQRLNSLVTRVRTSLRRRRRRASGTREQFPSGPRWLRWGIAQAVTVTAMVRHGHAGGPWPRESRDRAQLSRSREEQRDLFIFFFFLEGKALVTPFGWNIKLSPRTRPAGLQRSPGRGPLGKKNAQAVTGPQTVYRAPKSSFYACFTQF
jgi:hypothetical protein